MICQISDLSDNFEVDPETHFIKAFRADGDFYLIEPRAAMQLGVWARQRRMDLIEAQETLDHQGETQTG
jgi:hypothetical protein